jgi:hypothetical protein
MLIIVHLLSSPAFVGGESKSLLAFAYWNYVKLEGESARRIYGKLLCTVGNPCKRGNCSVLTFLVLIQGVGWRALTCAGVCLNQAKRSLFPKKTMMGQVDTTHTSYKISRMG